MSESLRRWRLILGRYAGHAAPLSANDRRIDAALQYLYDRAYQQRGIAGLPLEEPAADQLTAIDWLRRSGELFPREVCERLQRDAIEKFQLTALLQDPATLATLEPSQALARALLSMRGRLGAATRDAVRAVIRQVVEDITRRLRHDFVVAVSGRRNRFRRSALPSAQNFDWQATIRANLRHYDVAGRRLVIERPLFNSRVRRQLPWDVILCVDQSGSMLDSVMYSAVVAGILAALPSVTVRLVVFDTHFVDLSHLAGDPVDVLLTVQLGGGTDIGRAMQYCERLVRTPERTVLALVSDFIEGVPAAPLLACVQRLAAARVRLLGLAALDEQANPSYDHGMARRLAARGMEIAALTPSHFAAWLAEAMA